MLMHKNQQCGEISCKILQPGGSIGPKCVFQLLISEKSQNC